jgi:hypothetical protein
MYSVRRDPNNSSCYYSQYWSMNSQQQFIFPNRQMIKSKQNYFWSTKFSNSQDISLPVYRAPCTFQNSLITPPNKGKKRYE